MLAKLLVPRVPDPFVKVSCSVPIRPRKLLQSSIKTQADLHDMTHPGGLGNMVNIIVVFSAVDVGTPMNATTVRQELLELNYVVNATRATFTFPRKGYKVSLKIRSFCCIFSPQALQAPLCVLCLPASSYFSPPSLPSTSQGYRPKSMV